MKTRRLLIPIFVFAFALWAGGSGCGTRFARHQRDWLPGTWSCIAAIVDGKPLSAETVKLLRLTLTESRYKTERNGELLFDSTYSTDSSTSPRQINMIGTGDDLARKEAHGIYSLENDTLRICYTLPGKERPTTFDSPTGSGIFLIVWKRQQP